MIAQSGVSVSDSSSGRVISTRISISVIRRMSSCRDSQKEEWRKISRADCHMTNAAACCVAISEPSMMEFVAVEARIRDSRSLYCA